MTDDQFIEACKAAGLHAARDHTDTWIVRPDGPYLAVSGMTVASINVPASIFADMLATKLHNDREARKMEVDAALYGNTYHVRHPDGRITRLDPAGIRYNHPGSTPAPDNRPPGPGRDPDYSTGCNWFRRRNAA